MTRFVVVSALCCSLVACGGRTAYDDDAGRAPEGGANRGLDASPGGDAGNLDAALAPRTWHVEWQAAANDGVFLTSVWGSASTDIYVVGGYGQVMHSKGDGKWSTQTVADTHLWSVWGTSANDVYVGGDYKTSVLHGVGDGVWSTQTIPHGGRVVGFAATEHEIVSAVEGGFLSVSRGDGVWTAWGAGTLLEGFWASPLRTMFAVGPSGQIHHRAAGASSWSSDVSNVPSFTIGCEEPTPIPCDRYTYTPALQGVWGSSDSDVYAVGQYGTIVHFDGSTWKAQQSVGTLSPEWRAVWGASKDDVYVVGDGVLHGKGDGTWQAIDVAVPHGGFRAVWGVGHEVYIVGGKTILHYY